MVGEKGQKLRELADKVDEVERVEGEQREIEEDLKTQKWLEQQPSRHLVSIQQKNQEQY